MGMVVERQPEGDVMGEAEKEANGTSRTPDVSDDY